MPPAATTLPYGGTTSMLRHLLSRHSDKYGKNSKGSGPSESQCKLPDSFVHAKKCSAECAEEITSRMAEMVARDMWPISVIEGVGFKNLLGT